MVYIEPRKNKDGSVESYLVRWRPGKDPAVKMAYEPFAGADAELRAQHFMIAVKLAGENRPPYWAPHPIGRYLTPGEWEAYKNPLGLAPAGPAAPESDHPLLSYAADYTDRLTGIQPSTRAGYHRLLANYVRPFPPLAAADVEDVTEDEISDWVNWLERGEPDPDCETGASWLRAPLAPKTIANAHGLLFGVFAKACRGRTPLRQVNPCQDTRLPRLDDSTGEEMVFLTPAEYGVLWTAADVRAREVLAIAVGTAARFGEYTAFRVEDLHLETGRRIRVERAWKRQSESVPELGPPKSKAGRRTIMLDEVTGSVFASLTEGRAPSDYVLTDSHGQALRHGTWYGPWWQPAVYRAVRCEAHRAQDKAQGIMVNGEMTRLTSRRQLTMRWIVPCGCPGTLRKVPRVHDLRHTAVAWLIAANIPLKAIARRVGHESTNTTDKTYGHLLPELDERQSEAMFAALAPLHVLASGIPGGARMPAAADG